MKHLSKSEELEYLRRAKDINHCLGYGTSRIVFDCGDDRVIKVALTNKGQMQNRHELDVYESYPDYCGKIYAYGSYILVCDKMIEDVHDYLYEMFNEGIYPEDTDDIEEFIQDDEDINEETANLIREGMYVAGKLNDIVGWTKDNAQVGLFAGGYVAAFDFGYIPSGSDFEDCSNSDKQHNRQVDEVDMYVWHLGGAFEALQYVVDKISHKAKRLAYDRKIHKWVVKFS